MVSIEEDCLICCPYCMENISIRVDLSAGSDQCFSYDCEVCCRPIILQIDVSDVGTIQIGAEKEST